LRRRQAERPTRTTEAMQLSFRRDMGWPPEENAMGLAHARRLTIDTCTLPPRFGAVKK